MKRPKDTVRTVMITDGFIDTKSEKNRYAVRIEDPSDPTFLHYRDGKTLRKIPSKIVLAFRKKEGAG